tara:strand:+ start:315 stop:1412 length:1098 start_codon:yes stop_codon:yes gene_type:complete
LRSNKDEFSLEINEHYSVLGCIKTVRISQIRGFKPGSVYGHEVKLLTSPLVKKDVNGYVLLNYGDPRVSSILNKYDSNTKVEVVIIPDEHAAEAVEFLAGELNPQITPSTRFTDFFTSLSQSHSKQILVRDFFVKQASRSKSKLAFNLKRFLEKLGANAPTQSTASKLVSSANSVDVSKPTTNEHRTHTNTDTSQHTQKNQVSEVIDKEEALVEAAAELYYSIEPRSEEPYEEPYLDETFGPDSEQALTVKASSYDEYHKSDEFLDSTDQSNNEEATISSLATTKTKAHIDLTEEEMEDKWENHSNSIYSFALLRKILGPKQNQALTDRLNSLQPGTPEFDKFLSIFLELIEARLKEIKKHDPNC